MNLNLKFLESLKTKKTFKKEYFHVNPDKYWNMLLVLFFVIVLAGGGFSYYTFYSLNKDLSAYTTNSSIETFDAKQKEQIKNILEYFKIKEEKEKSLLKVQVSPVIDPEL